MKVTVTDGIRVVHDGKVYLDGETVDVPRKVADEWFKYGCAADNGPLSLVDARGLADDQFKSPEPHDKPPKSAAKAGKE